MAEIADTLRVRNLIFLATNVTKKLDHYNVYLEVQGLSDTGVYEDVASFALGLVFGMLLVGTLYTSRYIKRIQNLKKRLLKRQG